MNLAPIIERLADEIPSLKLTGGAAQFERAMGGLTALPAAFVLPARESAGESPFMDQAVEQRVNVEFAVAIAVRNLSDDAGAAAVESLEPVRVALREALLGWQPDGDSDGCEFVSGELVSFANGVLWWADTFRTAYLIRSI